MPKGKLKPQYMVSEDENQKMQQTFRATAVSPPPMFDFRNPDWERWYVRWERYRKTTFLDKMPDDYQTSLLLYTMGDEVEDILQRLRITKVDTMPYDDLVKVFHNYFEEKRNLVFERSKFFARVQNTGEPVSEFIADLHKLSLRCNLEPLREELVMHKIIQGMEDTSYSEKLQTDEGLNLRSVEEKVLQNETVKKQQAFLRSETIACGDIPRAELRQNHDQRKWNRKCLKCGRSSHPRGQQCPAVRSRCWNCGLEGHFARRCAKQSVQNVEAGADDTLKPEVQRLSQYEEYLEDLVKEAQRERLREDDHLQAALSRAKQAVKRATEESDLERIQDLFPNDSLRLYDRDVLTMRMKGLMRKRPSPAARLTRALSAKSLRPESPPPQRVQAHRHFIMESPVQFTAGVQSQERHLFLFNDLLLIAKARSGGNFKLKEKVRVSEIWISTTGLEEVSELVKSRDTSFIIGWPTTNVVATFSTQAARDLWLSKLSEVVNVEKCKEPSNTNIQVTFYDQATNIEYCKTLSVSPEETARGAMCAALAALDLPRHGNYQLWAQSAREEAPYPLIGHERPAAIKLSCLRDALSAEEGFDLDHCNNIHDPLARCQFILRSACKSPESPEKKSPKKMSGRMRIGQVFRRSLSKESPGCLFGLPLSRICPGDILPQPIVSMLQQVATKGPFTVGMFRKSANVRYVRELRSKLDAGQPVAMETVPVLAVGALLKDFLRSLPDPLLSSALYPRWRAAVETPNLHQRLIRIKGVLEELPPINRVLLRYVLCTLVLIARRSSTNLMSAANLGVCVGPSLLWQTCSGTPGDLRAVPALVEALITHAEVLCGPNITSLLGEVVRDSGTEESDSLRRDDSSIDSLECSPPPRKDKISLSRDSGLTMSDSQLYTPDEEESGSTSSSGYDPAFDQHAKVTTTISVPGEYVRVYGGWEERLNPNFQRQAWFRQRSRRINSVPSGAGGCPPPVLHSASQENLLGRGNSTLQARSASQESILDEPPPTPPRRQDLKPFEDIFKHHSPLRTVTAVHCEVISEPRRHQYRPVYATPKLPISASTVDVTKPLSSRLEEDDSSTLSDDDCTPHVSRSNSRGNEVTPKLRHLPPVHVESSFLRGRLRRKEEHRGSAHRSRSLPPAPAPQYTNKRAPITSYYLGDCIQPHYIVTRAYRDEESYV